MLWWNFKQWSIAVVLGFAVATTCVAEFAPPAEGPVAFRRDRLSLDTDTMAKLSSQLVVLARGVGMESAVDRRTVARMLALALALDPGKVEARTLISTFENAPDRSRPASDAAIDKNLSRVWQTLDWLEQPQAGSDAHALAACLLDILAVADPQNPRSLAAHDRADRGTWGSWIPPLAAYEEKLEMPEPDPEPEPTETPKTGILLEKARVATVMWQNLSKEDSAPDWQLTPVTLDMSASMATTEEESAQPFSLSVGTATDPEAGAALVPTILKALKREHGKLPAGGKVVISSEALGKSQQLSKKRQSITAAVTVLASAAISGVEPNATILGLVDENGAFTVPPDFWMQLRALGPGNGGKLVLPAAAADYLPSMLALEKPEFFFEREVVLAASFRDLLDLSAKEPPPGIAAISAQFQEIRAKLGTQAMREYIANPFVRRRLVEMNQEAPYHSTARMLATQAAGKRPVLISRIVLCAEIRRILEPVMNISDPRSSSNSADTVERITKIYESTKAGVDGLFRYTDKPDRDMLDKAQDVVGAIRTLERAYKSRGETSVVQTAVNSAYTALARSYTSLMEEVANETGDRDAIPTR